MANGQRIATEKESEKKADTLDDLTGLRLVAVTAKPESESSSSTMPQNAVTSNDSRKTLTSAKLQELRSKLSLVAGALADFQSAGGVIVRKEMSYTLPSGSQFQAMKFVLAVKGYNLVAVQTPDGIELDLVAESDE